MDKKVVKYIQRYGHTLTRYLFSRVGELGGSTEISHYYLLYHALVKASLVDPETIITLITLEQDDGTSNPGWTSPICQFPIGDPTLKVEYRYSTLSSGDHLSPEAMFSRVQDQKRIEYKIKLSDGFYQFAFWSPSNIHTFAVFIQQDQAQVYSLSPTGDCRVKVTSTSVGELLDRCLRIVRQEDHEARTNFYKLAGVGVNPDWCWFSIVFHQDYSIITVGAIIDTVLTIDGSAASWYSPEMEELDRRQLLTAPADL